MRLAPAQVHAQQHCRPILRLGAAGTGLDVEERVVGVHLARKHAPEFERGQFGVERLDVLGDRLHQAGVALGARQFQQIAGLAEARIQAEEILDLPLEARALAA